MNIRSDFFRSRWTAIGVAVTVSAIAGSFAIANAAGEGAPSSFVPITPCRLLDTRAAAPVGARQTPLNPGETFQQQVSGTNGKCVIPAGISGVAMNVTVANGTAASFLTVWPSDATQPLASNLNWVGGQQPTPNKVDVRVSPDGKISFFNNGGTVDVIADVVGFYQKASGPAGIADPGRVIVDPAAFSTDAGSADLIHHDFDSGLADGTTGSGACGQAQVELPDGATVTNVTAHGQVNSGGPGKNLRVQLWRNPIGIEDPELMFERTSTGSPVNVVLTGDDITSPTIDNAENSYYVTVCGLTTVNKLFDVLVNYSVG